MPCGYTLLDEVHPPEGKGLRDALWVYLQGILQYVPVTECALPLNKYAYMRKAQEKKSTGEEKYMESRVSVISIIVKDEDAAAAVNEILHEFRQYIVGRMGIPYRERGVSIISVVLDAPGNATSALSGKLGMLKGVSAKTLTAKL